MSETPHRSGFINIIGRPNVGKSTLMNALVGERMSIISNKPQTTRHRIIGILNGDDFQAVFSDTPGMVRKPSYKMHDRMNAFVHGTFDDADLMLLVTFPGEEYEDDDPIWRRLTGLEVPLFLLMNKIDEHAPEAVEKAVAWWSEKLPQARIFQISALKKTNTEALLEAAVACLAEGPAFYPKDQLTDRPERFFVSEIIREKIFQTYRQEIPYSCEVIIEDYKDTETNRGEAIARIRATIIVDRDSQKPIIIGRAGEALKKVGTAARGDIEKFIEKKAFLELSVKVRDNWRDDERSLKHFGYDA